MNVILPKYKIFFPRKIQGLASISWQKYLPTPEQQKFIFDTDCCMSYSSTHCVETYLNYLKATGQIPASILAQCEKLGYFDTNGSFAFSVRFNAIMNATNPNTGASFDQVWQGIQKYGLLPESDFNFTMAQAQLDPTQMAFWSDFFDPADVTDTMKTKALIFNTLFEVNYGWIITAGIQGMLMKAYNFVTGQNQTTNLQDALGNAPVHAALYPCPSWNTGQVSYCGDSQPAHGIEIYQANADSTINIFDTYNPFQKVLEVGYVIPYAVLPSISVIQKPVYIFTSTMTEGDFSTQVKQLQVCLSYLGYLPLSPSQTTYTYGPMTAAAVLKFQQAQGISPTSEANAGPKTIAALNAIFSTQSGV